jgi:hypothetical protein
MKHICIPCKYSTNHKGHFDAHAKTQIHSDKVILAEIKLAKNKAIENKSVTANINITKNITNIDVIVNVLQWNTANNDEPVASHKWELIIFNYLKDKYRFYYDRKLFKSAYRYDFYLLDYDLYLEIDEEKHFTSCASVSKNIIAINDQKKNILYAENKATLLRISYNKIKNIKEDSGKILPHGTFIDMIKFCIHNSTICNKIILSSLEEYGKQQMIDGINPTQIHFYCSTDTNNQQNTVCNNFKCYHCKGTFTRMSGLTRHEQICGKRNTEIEKITQYAEKNKVEADTAKKQVEDLQKQAEYLREQIEYLQKQNDMLINM